MESPKTLQQAIQFFGDFENCRQFMIAVRWSDGKVRCPQCDSEKITYLEKARVYRCYGDHSKQKFSLKIGTVFEDSPIPLEKWLPAVWLLVSCKNGISSYEIASALGITQKSAWFMMHRIRRAMQCGSFRKLGGTGSGGVEVDETFIGGKARNMHKARKARLTGRIDDDKAVVVGFMERGGEVRTQIVDQRRKHNMQPLVREHVQAGAALYTDALKSYIGLDSAYEHQVIDHAVEYVHGRVHTNTLENFWSLVKRGLHGTYISVEPFHLFRYLDEQMFRYNNRKRMDNADRFKLALSQIVGKRLTFAEVTGKVGETAF